jgi:hypothetical protein
MQKSLLNIVFSAWLMSPCEKRGLGEKSVSVYVISSLQDIYQARVFFLVCLQLIISFGDSEVFNKLLT